MVEKHNTLITINCVLEWAKVLIMYFSVSFLIGPTVQTCDFESLRNVFGPQLVPYSHATGEWSIRRVFCQGKTSLLVSQLR